MALLTGREGASGQQHRQSYWESTWIPSPPPLASFVLTWLQVIVSTLGWAWPHTVRAASMHQDGPSATSHCVISPDGEAPCTDTVSAVQSPESPHSYLCHCPQGPAALPTLQLSPCSALPWPLHLPFILPGTWPCWEEGAVDLPHWADFSMCQCSRPLGCVCCWPAALLAVCRP